MGGKRTMVSLCLLAFFLLSLAAAIVLYLKVSALEAEQAALMGQTDFAAIAKNVDRNIEITQALHGRCGLYRYQSQAAAAAGISGFLCFCDGMERLKKRIYRRN